MNVTGWVWRELTREERLVALGFAAEENQKKMQLASAKR